MAYYKTCTECGAHLDPQERCDCQLNTAQDSAIFEKEDGAISSSANMIDQFEDHLAAVGMRPNTINTYVGEVKRLNRYFMQTYGLDLSRKSDLSSATSLQLRNYLDDLADYMCRQKTRNLYTIVIRRFFDYHQSVGNIYSNPSEKLPRQRNRNMEQENKLDESKYYTKDVIGDVISFLNNQMGKNCKKRDLALFALLCASAMRINEACSLSVIDMATIRKGWVHVVGKGGQREQVDIASYAIDYLDLYLQTRENVKPDDPLFLSQKGGRLTENAAWKAFARFQKPLGIPTGTHICRHTALTHIAHDAGVLVARDAARHKDVKTTNNYIHRMHDRVIQTAEATSVAKTFTDVVKGA